MSDWAKYEIVNVAGSAGVPAIDCMTLNYPTPVHRGADLSEAQQQENKTKILGALKEVYNDALHGIELGMSGKWVGHPLQLLMVMAAYADGDGTPADGVWCPLERLGEYALPSLMKKVVAHAMKAG